MARKSNPLFRPLPTGAFYYVQLLVGFLFMLWPLGFVWWSYTRGFF